MFAIVASVHTTNGEWSGTRHLPTFYLDPRVQGIVDTGHAERIAHRMLTDVNPDASISVSAYAT